MTALSQLVVLSLEPWDDVWRRNQLLVEALSIGLPDLRVLFVEPPLAALRNFHAGRPPRSARRSVDRLPGVTALRTVQWTPDRLTPYVPLHSGRAVLRAAKVLGFDEPVLWVNNHSLARFALRSGWPIVYDITDDWLLAGLSPGKRRRAELDDQLLLRGADAVVVCSPALAASRGVHRDVVVIPNGIDVAHFTTPQPRPDDLGAGPVVVYVGTLQEERLDVQLCCDIADDLADVQFVYVGPDCLQAASRYELARRANVQLLGPRPYAVVPAYLQHADAIFIPHVVSPFTESLDPIKARECLAVGTPTVATPIAGFRELGATIRVATPADFARELVIALREDRRVAPPADLWTWTAAGRAFADVLESINRYRRSSSRSSRRGRDE
jgi:glycosyltransferase involved in cell wall biosynthesis